MWICNVIEEIFIGGCSLCDGTLYFGSQRCDKEETWTPKQVHGHSCWLYRFQLWVTTKVRSQQSMHHAFVVSLLIAFSRIDMKNKSVFSKTSLEILSDMFPYCSCSWLCFINNSQTFALKCLSPQINQCDERSVFPTEQASLLLGSIESYWLCSLP